MSYKNGFNVMDKYFFGKPLTQWACENSKLPKKTTKVEQSSIDDFNKYFDFIAQALRRPLERTPETDVFVPERKVLSFANIEDSIGPSF